MQFQLKSPYQPAGDQPTAIEQLVAGIRHNDKHQTLLGVTGSGKTFTMANVIQQVQMPTLVLSHNKTLAAQLYQEFKEFFPDNAVEYFVSFYDYYQPEAYLPATDTYIEKTSEINDEIDRLRLKATSSLLARKDVIIVASVSCIYNIGSAESYGNISVTITAGQQLDRKALLKQFYDMRYTRNDMSFERATFRVRGDIIDIYPAYEETAIRIETFGDTVESLKRIQPLDGATIGSLESVTIFPAKHFASGAISMDDAIAQITKELNEQLARFRSQGKLLEAQRLEQRTLYDIEMLREVGFVSGVENYSRILDGREPGSKPNSLIDFFKPPYLLIVDESHVSIPQIGGMFNGDHARKTVLVEHGFRIPCALDNRPLRFEEYEKLTDFVIYSSATPADYELKKSGGVIVEQIIRPTGLIDPPIEVKPAKHQIDDLIHQLRETVAAGGRALVTTLTKKMSEDLTEYLESLNFRVQYLHSEIEALERSDILHNLRKGSFDVLVGINLLREGLDLPEVSFVAILDADKEGFLRSARSLIQISGRAARHIDGRIILYADTRTDSIKKALDESDRRRTIQIAYNKEHGITPQSVARVLKGPLSPYGTSDEPHIIGVAESSPSYRRRKTKKETRKETIEQQITRIDREMRQAAANLEFEKAAKLRDSLASLRLRRKNE
jgi:excinuclease ABC subunit B